MAEPPRVVLDTSVVVSALVFGGGTVGRLRTGWQAGMFVPLVCAVTTRELVRVLGYRKFALSASEQEELLADYLPWAEVVDLGDPPPTVPECRDPYDMPFLQLAARGRAHALVSSDRHLLDLAGRLGRCEVMEVAAFCTRFLNP